ncbi:MAG TPA: hypothetical protein VIV12_14465 [Streptosporangiaceae bacterium]
MSVPEYYLRRCAEVLRRDGSVVAPLATAAERQVAGGNPAAVPGGRPAGADRAVR